jgi:hypothetical protein
MSATAPVSALAGAGGGAPDVAAAAAAAPAAAAAGPEVKPRLMIMKMVMENFKSYGGIREIGPFHKCFSAVVGPNGRYVRLLSLSTLSFTHPHTHTHTHTQPHTPSNVRFFCFSVASRTSSTRCSSSLASARRRSASSLFPS